jgi:DNA-binding LytR/AlgR family response regulator
LRRQPNAPAIVFVTAHDEFAVRAFELDAVDYLVKPVRPERLVAAIERARRRTAEEPRSAAVSPSTRIVVIERGALRLFDARDVSRFWARDKYTLFHSAGDERLTLEALSTLATRLEPVGFMRVHRGELINVARVRAVRVEDGQHVAELDDGQAARVSRRVLAAFKAALRVPSPG